MAKAIDTLNVGPATPVMLVDPLTGGAVTSGQEAPALAATVQTVVAQLTTVQVLAAANAARKGLSVHFDAAAVLFLIVGDQAPGSTLYAIKMGQGLLTYWECPVRFVGQVRGFFSAAGGVCNVTEYA